MTCLSTHLVNEEIVLKTPSVGLSSLSLHPTPLPKPSLDFEKQANSLLGKLQSEVNIPTVHQRYLDFIEPVLDWAGVTVDINTEL